MRKTKTDDHLDFSQVGYWVAGLMEEGACRGFKQYYDARFHGKTGGEDLLRSFMEVNGITEGLCSKLSDVARDLEGVSAQDLRGVVLQVRHAPITGEVQPKIYFRPARLPGIGIRRAAMKIARLVAAMKGENEGQHVYQTLLRRDQAQPLHYISVALRPELEVETYHDCEAVGLSHFSSSHVGQALGLTSPSLDVSRAVDIIRQAERHGFHCLHFAVDLLGGQGATSLFLDVPREDPADHVAALMRDLRRIPGCRSQIDGASDLRIEKSFTPAIVGVKLMEGPQSEFDLLTEEVSLEYKAFF